MRPEKGAEVAAWLRKAGHDLAAAKKLLEGANPLADVAVYHCQQAGEKALKAFLTAIDRPFGRTHSLVELVQEAAEVEPAFLSLREQAETLTPFASRFRYPGGFDDPDPSDARDAVQMAAEILDFVLAHVDEAGN